MAFCAPQCLPVYKPRGSSFSLSCALSRPQNKAEDEVSTLTPDESFATWAKANMVDMSSLALASWEPQKLGMNASSRGMTATAPLKKGNRLITVSCQSTLQVTSLDGKKSPIPHQISGETWQRLPWFARLALLLLDAKLDPKSNMKLWIQKLPKSFDTPFHWSERELLELQNRKMIQSVHEQRKLYRKLYNDINGNADNLLARKLKYDDFVWAVECIRSRAFSGPLEVAPFKERARLFLFIIANTIAWPAINILSWENALNGGLTALFALTMYDILTPKILKVIRGLELKRYAMTPGIDMINHDSSVTGKAEVSYEYFSEKFVIEAGENYNIGDHVSISYGAQSNDAFLQYYGFVEERNPADTYAFGKEVEDILGVQSGSLIAREKTGFDNSSIQAVAKRLGGNKESARKALSELCTAELSGMLTSLEEDLKMFEEVDSENHRLRLALQYRIGKKRILATALQY